MPRRPEQLVPLGELVAQDGRGALWQGQSTLVETNQGFAFLAGAGVRVPIGVGVTLTPLRHPYYAAMEARSLALATGSRVTFGLGPGGTSFQVALRGAAYPSQLGAMRDYLVAVRQLLTGVPVQVETADFACAARLPSAPSAPIELGFGVLRPRMARLAGEVADAAITWLTPARYLREVVVPALEEGAAAAGRPRPRLVTILPIARRRARHEPYQLAMASNFAHSRAPHYIDMLGKAGIAVDAADPVAGARAIVAGGAFLCGEPDELAEMVQEYWDAGVDEIVLNVTGVYNVEGLEAALEELRVLLAMLPAGADVALVP
ncbi:LLM class flavin-dependent oxidoreductase [Georgenia satyanarayanai]|uniref:LLM class flavin-dependent oxidoreductase n=1 Tax=Georgenia satyanarayanai TaxID=860221 RepID=UPI001C64F0F4|nr:LLM class flavin-dependent oxidoreductase [Georgenia satyanarayanai]